MTFTPTIPARFSSLCSRFAPPSRAERLGSPTLQGSAPLPKTFPLCLSVLLFLAVVSTAVGQWSRDPQHALELGDVGNAQLISDSAGGVFLAAMGGSWCYYVDANGYPRWNEWINPAPLAFYRSGAGHAMSPESGVLIALTISTWISNGDTSWDLRAQKIDTTGEFLWPDSGVSISNMRLRFADDAAFGVIGTGSDGEGGVIVVWIVQYYLRDHWNEPYLDRQAFLAQRVSAEGVLLWGEEGVAIADEDSLYTKGRMVTYRNGDVAVIYLVAHGVIGLQRINGDGERLWGENGVTHDVTYPIGIGTPTLFNGSAVLLNAVGIHDGLRSVNLFCFDEEGRQSWGNAEGLVANAVPYLMGGYANSEIIVADDNIYIKMEGDSLRGPHPLVQSITPDGQMRWQRPGIYIGESDSMQYNSRGLQSSGSIICAWHDNRDVNGHPASIFTQRIDNIGRKLWGDNDLVLFNHSGIGVNTLVSDINGGAIFLLGGYYLQYINREGDLGIPLFIRSFDQPLLPGSLSFSVYPNPTNGLTTISFTRPAGTNMRLQFFDFQGRLVFNDFIPQSVSAYPLDLSLLPTGSYVLSIQSGAAASVRTLNVVK